LKIAAVFRHLAYDRERAATIVPLRCQHYLLPNSQLVSRHWLVLPDPRPNEASLISKVKMTVAARA
jgi:hypothetical protein